jgi:hypothetical protein
MPHSEQQQIQHQLFRLRFTELNEIYATMSLRTLGLGLIGIFIPIFLYTNHYTIRDFMVIYFIMYITELIFEYVSARMIRTIGPKHLIAFSIPVTILHFWILSTLVLYHWPFWLIGITGGLGLALYWQPYHYDFSLSKHTRKATREVSRVYILLALMSAMAPFLGGVIATQFGVGYLYLAVLLLLGSAIFPLLKTSEPIVPKGDFDLRKIKLREIKKDVVSYIGNGWESTTVASFWPLFVFLIVKDYQSVGFLTSLALVITVVTTYFVGRQADKKDRSQFIKASGLLSGVLNALQVFAFTASHVMMLNLGRNLADSLGNAPYTSEYYLHADEKSRSEYLYIMESMIDIGRILLFGGLILLSYFVTTRWILIAALIMGGVGSLLFTLMPRAECEICRPVPNRKIRVSRHILSPSPVKVEVEHESN